MVVNKVLVISDEVLGDSGALYGGLRIRKALLGVRNDVQLFLLLVVLLI